MEGKIITFDGLPAAVAEILARLGNIEASMSNTGAMQRQAETPSFVSRTQVCEMLGISTATLHNWINSGRVQAYHIGGRTLFKASEIDSAVKPVNVHVNTGKEAL